MLVGAMLHFSWLECLKREANDFSHDYGLHLWLFSPDHKAVMFMILINVSLVGIQHQSLRLVCGVLSINSFEHTSGR